MAARCLLLVDPTGCLVFPLLLEQAFSLLLNVGTGSESAMQGGGHLEDIRLWPYAAVLLWVLLSDLLIFSPMRLGQIWFYSQINRGKPADIAVLFAPYRHGNYARSLRWRLRLWGMNGLWGTLFLFPRAILWACGSWLGSSVSSSLFPAFLFFMRRSRSAAGISRPASVDAARRTGRSSAAGRLPSPFGLSPVQTGNEKGPYPTWPAYLRLAGWAASCLLLIPGLYAYPFYRSYGFPIGRTGLRPSHSMLPPRPSL